jgi:hypothetical protein
MRWIALVAVVALSACIPEDKTPVCMTPQESGVVLSVNSESGVNYGRGGPYPWQISTVTVRMNNGVSRICSIRNVDAKMFPIGERVNLALAKRAL